MTATPSTDVQRAALEALTFHAITGPQEGAFTRDHAKALIDFMASGEARNGVLEEALRLALARLIVFEPPDSRAVSDEFVAMAAIAEGGDIETPECIEIVRRAKAALSSPMERTSTS